MTKQQYLNAHKKNRTIPFEEFQKEFKPVESNTIGKPFYTWSKLEFTDGTLIVPTFIFSHPNLKGYVITEKKIETFAPIVLL